MLLPFCILLLTFFDRVIQFMYKIKKRNTSQNNINNKNTNRSFNFAILRTKKELVLQIDVALHFSVFVFDELVFDILNVDHLDNSAIKPGLVNRDTNQRTPSQSTSIINHMDNLSAL